MFIALNYNHQKHPYADIPGQPSQAPKPDPESSAKIQTNGEPSSDLPNGNTAQTAATTAQPADATGPEEEKPPVPDTPEVFEQNQRELAQAIVVLEQQMEVLINSLPGLERSEGEQMERMRQLEAELRDVEAERAKAERVREDLIKGLEEVIVGRRSRRAP